MTDQSLPQPGDLLKNRYQILEQIDSENTLIRYRAQDQETAQPAILVGLTFAATIAQSKIQLLENELDILLQLNHPGIQRYHSYFKQESTQSITLYVVQAEIKGLTLADLISKGWKPTENTMQKVAKELCQILVYLHNLNPPLPHQAIQPKNILRQDNGKFILTNFGIVQGAYLKALAQFPDLDQTRYVVPEQLEAQNQLTDDLYSLGLTLLFLLTRKDPQDFPIEQQKIWFCQTQPLSKSLQNWLEKLIVSEIAQRFTSAEEALLALSSPSSSVDQSLTKVPFNPIIVQKKGAAWFIGLSPLWIASRGTHLLFGVLLLIALQPMMTWIASCIQTSILESQITFANTPCTPQTTRDQLKQELRWQISPTASRAEIALTLVKIAKNLLPKDQACAEGALQEAIRLQPKLAVAYNNLGVLKHEQKKYGAAIAAFQEALQLNPGYGEANSNLGIALESNGSQLEAIRVFGKVQPNNLYPEHQVLSLVLGVPTLSSANGDEIPSSAEAVRQYRQAIQLYPNAEKLHYNLAVALDSQGNLDAAIVEYQSAIQLKSTFAEAYGNLANAYAIKGKRIEAYIHFQQARELFRSQNRFQDVQKVEQLMHYFQFL